MGKTTGIDYCDASWGPWRGCTKVSAGCQRCYAEREMKRFGTDFNTVTRAADKTFNAPLHWKESQKIFVCPWGDFFHEKADEWRGDALNIMRDCSQHTFVIPTKRPERIIECIYGETKNILNAGNRWDVDHLPNVWFLASVENQEQADKRIPELLKLREYGDWPVLGVSIEPMLGEIDLSQYWLDPMFLLDWVICGGESGPNARLCHPDWVRSLRDQCVEAGVPFFFKQHGAWLHETQEQGNYTNLEIAEPYPPTCRWSDGSVSYKVSNQHLCLLDGREWKEYPTIFPF